MPKGLPSFTLAAPSTTGSILARAELEGKWKNPTRDQSCISAGRGCVTTHSASKRGLLNHVGGQNVARTWQEIRTREKILEPAAFPCHFALIFQEQKLHQGSRRRVGRGERKSRSVSLHNLERKAREKPLDKCHLDGWLWTGWPGGKWPLTVKTKQYDPRSSASQQSSSPRCPPVYPTPSQLTYKALRKTG